MKRIEPILHLVPLCFGVLTAVVALSLNLFGPLFAICWIEHNHRGYQGVFYLLPLWLAIGAVTVFSLLIYCYVRKTERQSSRYRFNVEVQRKSLATNSATNPLSGSLASSSRFTRENGPSAVDAEEGRRASVATSTTGRRSSSSTQKGESLTRKVARRGFWFAGAFYFTWFFLVVSDVFYVQQKEPRQRNPGLHFTGAVLAGIQGIPNVVVYLAPQFQQLRRQQPDSNFLKLVFASLRAPSSSATDNS